MRMQELTGAIVLSMISALMPTQGYAFTAQLPISGYRFTEPLRIYNQDVGALTSVFTVPDNRIAVITDIYLTLEGAATGTHTTFLTNDSFQTIAGPFTVTASSPFSMNYTSGLIWIEGKQIVVSDTGGTGDVIVNLVGYMVCREPCTD